MNKLIEIINQNIKEYFNYYELMNYFRNHSSSLSQVLSNACSYEINNTPDSLSNSLTSSLLSKNISQDDIKSLDSILDKLENNILKARIYHLLFLKRDKKHKDDAINAMLFYSQSIDQLIKKDIYLAVDFLFITIYLGNSIDFKEQSYIIAESTLIRLLQEMKLENPIMALRVLDIVNRLGLIPREDIIEISNFISDKLISKNEELKAILALEIAKSNISPNMRTLLDDINRKISNCYIAIAHFNQGFNAAHFLLNAINTLAKIKGTRVERLALYEEMRDYQIESMLDLKYCETEPYNISALLRESADILNKSEDLFDMLFRIACCICDIVVINELKKSEIQQGKSFIDLFYSQQIYIDHQGMNMTTGEIPSILDFEDIPEEDKQSLWSKIIMRMKIHHQISVEVIQESLRTLNATYNVKYKDILNLCTNNPFIPSNHEEFFAKGIFSGLRGDFLTACHLLVPQIENSLRHLLELRAEEPTTLHANKEQERDGLKALLENPEIIKIFGIDGVIHLRTLLIDKRYPGLRHSVAHGFVPSDYFYGTGAIYTWWLIFRIIMVPYKDFWEKKYIKNETTLDN